MSLGISDDSDESGVSGDAGSVDVSGLSDILESGAFAGGCCWLSYCEDSDDSEETSVDGLVVNSKFVASFAIKGDNLG